MTHTITPSPEQFAAIQRGEGIEIVERVEPQPEWNYPGNYKRGKVVHHNRDGDFVLTAGFGLATEQKNIGPGPYALDDRIAVVCPDADICGNADGDECESEFCNDEATVTVISIAPREIDGVWCWVVGMEVDGGC
jgi:hypothetical protein